MCTLQELAKGTTKKRKITHHVLHDGKPQPKEVRGAGAQIAGKGAYKLTT